MVWQDTDLRRSPGRLSPDTQRQCGIFCVTTTSSRCWTVPQKYQPGLVLTFSDPSIDFARSVVKVPDYIMVRGDLLRVALVEEDVLIGCVSLRGAEIHDPART